MRNRFLAYEVYEECYAPRDDARAVGRARPAAREMHGAVPPDDVQRIVPNLKRIGLLTDRIRPHYEQLGLLEFEHGRAAPELTAQDLLDDAA